MRDMIKRYTEPAFLICSAVLVLSAAGMSVATKKLGICLQKEPLPLKKSLSLLDEADLSPYVVVSKGQIKNAEVIKTLGTDQYIQWLLDDTDEAIDSDIRRCSLFITYYDLPDNVPHVPEECYIGGGNESMSSEGLKLSIGEKALQCRYLVFLDSAVNQWQGPMEFSVLYFLNANGKYLGNRTDARKTLNKNIFGKSSYFCKVEWNFLTASGVRANPGKEKVERASEKFLSVILPILEKEHWPDWGQEN